jgi:hypothetical protein
MEGYAVTQGTMPQFAGNGGVRPRVFYGSTRDELRDLCEEYQCTWSIQNGRLTIIPLNAAIGGEVALLAPQTGIVGVPEQSSDGGVNVRVLLNPVIRIGQIVQLIDTNINQVRYGLDVNSESNNPTLAKSTLKLNAQGYYYVMKVDLSGDTRGNEWYSDLTCLAVDATVPLNGDTYGPSFSKLGTVLRY